MKKQIFILVMAFFAISFQNAFGQTLAPKAIECMTIDALHPVAGQPFNYDIQVPALAGTKAYTWFVTQQQNFIAGGVLTSSRDAVGTSSMIFATGSGYNDATTATNTVSITWKSFTYDDTKPIFVVIQATNNNGVTCTTQNMKVYKIIPQNAFTLDIANLAPGTNNNGIAGALQAGYGSVYDRCIHNIVSATYDATTPLGVVYNFGQDTLFYEVVAANFNTSWKPTFNLTGTATNETVTVAWATDKAFTTANELTMAGTVWSSSAVYATTTTGGSVGANGESIYVRVVLDHSTTVNYEGLADETVILAVDGKTNLLAVSPAVAIGDVHYANGQASAGPPVVCNPTAEDGYTNDIATQILKPRPTITAGATMPAPGILNVKP